MTKITIMTPQFERPANDPKPIQCPDRKTIEGLTGLSPGELRELGLRPWNNPDDFEDNFDPPMFRNHRLWLLPGEWFSELPDGMHFTDINGGKVVTPDDGDIRFGCLAYGVLVPHGQ